MNTVELVKQLCKERGIPLSHVEKNCGFANGYIGQLKKGSIPYDRLVKISKYLGVDTEYLLTGGESTSNGYYLNEETAQMAQEMFEDKDMRSLFHMKRNMQPDEFKAHVDFMKTLYKREHPEDIE